MTNLWLHFIIILLLCSSISEARKQYPRKKSACKEIEECIKGENDIECVKRVKRHCPESTPSTCNECDCDYCSENDCSSTCDSCCSTGRQITQPCSNRYCCYKTCHAQCRSQTCRSRCRSSCDKTIVSEITGTGSGQIAEAVNVTTIINLHNKINNTNLIDVPVNVNNSNYNNVTVDSSFEGYNVDGGYPQVPIPLPPPVSPQYPSPPPISPQYPPISPQYPPPPLQQVPPNIPPSSPPYQPGPPQYPPKQSPPCCQIISPRQCVPQQQYPFTKCIHYRRKHCGPTCTSHIMHAQPHQVCDQAKTGPPQCHSQLIYVPQPQRCVYQPTWPYVNCGGPSPNCEGCNDPELNEESKQSCARDCLGFNGVPQGVPPFMPPFGGYPGAGPFMGGPFLPFQGLPYAGGVPFGYPPLLGGPSPNMDSSGSVVMDQSFKRPVPGVMNGMMPVPNMGNMPINMGNMRTNMGNIPINMGNVPINMRNMGANMGNGGRIGSAVQTNNGDWQSSHKVPSINDVTLFPNSQPFEENSIFDYSNEIDYSDGDFLESDLHKRGAQYPSKGMKKSSENRRKKHHESKKKDAMIVVESTNASSNVEDKKQG